MTRRVVIFGATGGIGMALVEEYAATGVQLHLIGRRKAVLEMASSIAQNKGAEVVQHLCDIREIAATENLIESLCALSVPQTWIFAGGVSASVERQNERSFPESSWALAREMDVNAKFVMLSVNAVARCAMRRNAMRPHIQIGLISSVAALTGLPSSPGYSASKAALMIYAQATRRLLAAENIGVTVILPGFVTSDMSRRYQGNKPFEMTAKKAARIIRISLEKNRAKVVFPEVLGLGIRLLDWLPERLQGFFLKPFVFSVEPDLETLTYCKETKVCR